MPALNRAFSNGNVTAACCSDRCVASARPALLDTRPHAVCHYFLVTASIISPGGVVNHAGWYLWGSGAERAFLPPCFTLTGCGRILYTYSVPNPTCQYIVERTYQRGSRSHLALIGPVDIEREQQARDSGSIVNHKEEVP